MLWPILHFESLLIYLSWSLSLCCKFSFLLSACQSLQSYHCWGTKQLHLRLKEVVCNLARLFFPSLTNMDNFRSSFGITHICICKVKMSEIMSCIKSIKMNLSPTCNCWQGKYLQGSRRCLMKRSFLGVFNQRCKGGIGWRLQPKNESILRIPGSRIKYF